MKKIITMLLGVLVFATSSFTLAKAPGDESQGNQLPPGATFQKTVVTSAPVKVSKPLRELAKPFPKLTEERKNKLLKSGEGVPGVTLIKEMPNHFPFKNKDVKRPEGFVDTAAQLSMKKNAASRSAPEAGVSFDGISNFQGFFPPDTNGDVGPNHYVQTVNVAIAIWDKLGNELIPPTALNSLWSGFGGICETNNNGDPIVLYDSAADRWLISQFAFSSSTDNHQCIAISQTGDPTGAYFLYDFFYGTVFNDYPHFGVWNDGYYMGVNQFSGNSFAGGAVVAYEREKMLNGAVAQQVKFDMNGSTPTVFTPMPLDQDGALPPPAEAHEYFIWSDFDTFSKLQVWEFAVNWVDPGLSTFTQVTALDVTPFNSAPQITQPNGSGLDSLSVRSMFRAAYRNLDGQGKVVFTHNIKAPAGTSETALRWYEINVDQLAGTANLVQESTFAPDTESRWMGSGAMDINGNIAFGYSIASSDMFPSVAAATRLASDPLNTLTDEIILHAGEGSQGGASRWGDYSNLSIDPVDECTFWFTTEYYKAADNDTTSWSTRIASFKLPTCTAGPRGELTGTVIDAATEAPIPGATVSIGAFSTLTDEMGNYTLTLPIGDYPVTAGRYGWIDSTAVTASVIEDEQTTNNISLNVAPRVTVNGKVIDGNGPTPLYAKVIISVPGDTLETFTNPVTGTYSIDLVEGVAVLMTATEQGLGGYLDTSASVTPVAGPSGSHDGVDFNLSINSNCTAPGYHFLNPAFFEGFDSFPATGWTVEDVNGNGAVWTSYLAGSRSFPVETDAAIADSDRAGFVNMDTNLVSPVIQVSSLTSKVLNFDVLYRSFTGADKLEVDVNVDGSGWTNVSSLPQDNVLKKVSFDLTTMLAGATTVQVRFHYFDANFEWYALVDNVAFGSKTCVPTSGSVVSGFVKDANTNLALIGSTVAIDDIPAAITVATESDSQLDDGFFQLFIPDSATSISVSHNGYQTATPVAGDITLATPVLLKAGQLTTGTEQLSPVVTAGRTATETITLTNTGTADAKFAALLLNGDPSTASVAGRFDASTSHFGPDDLNDLNTAKSRDSEQTYNFSALAPGEISGFFPTDLVSGWGVSLNRNSGDFWVGDIALGGAATNTLYKYDAQGQKTGDTIDMNFVQSGFFADSAFNQRTGMLWQVDVGNDNCIHEIDTVSKTVTGKVICPDFAVSQRGLAYDPLTDTFYSGSWNDSIIHQFKTDGTLIRSVNVGLPIAGLAYNSATKHLFISANGRSSSGDFDIIVVDAASPGFVKIGGYDVRLDVDGDGVPDDVISDNGQAGLDIDCNGNLWIVEQNQQFVVGFDAGETGVCDWNHLSWLSTSASQGLTALAINESSDVSVNIDTANLAVGDYSAAIVFYNDTPYGDLTVPLNLTVTEPQYGALGFNITSVAVNENDTATLTIARTDGADFAVSVDYTTVDGSALAGTDYSSVSGTLNWDDLDSAAKTITVQTNLLDQNKTFSVALSNPQGGARLSPKMSATVTIKNKPKGGSMGIPLLILFTFMAITRRRFMIK